jgi:CHAD domain-containing protein
VAIDADGAAADFALAAARRHFAEFVQREPGTRLGEDAEELHQMRVAARRLRTVLGDLGAVLPARYAALREGLGWVAGPLGQLRDLDVQREALAARQAAAPPAVAPAFHPLLIATDGERAAARAELLMHLQSSRFSAFVDSMSTALRIPDAPADASTTARDAASQLLRRRYRQFRRSAAQLKRSSPAVEYHDVRRRARRLRYTLDSVGPILDGRGERLLAAVHAVQDLLGEHQDCDVSITRLRSLQAERGDALPASTQRLIDDLCEADAARMHTLRRKWPNAFARVRRRWRGLGSSDRATAAEPGG